MRPTLKNECVVKACVWLVPFENKKSGPVAPRGPGIFLRFLFIRPRRSEAPWLAYGESRACTPQCFLRRSLVVSRSPAQVNERLVYKRRPRHILPRYAPANHIAHDDRHLAGKLNTRLVL